MKVFLEIIKVTKIINPKWIKLKRLESGCSYREMAVRLGCSAPFLSDVEKGRRQIKPDSDIGKTILEMWGG